MELFTDERIVINKNYKQIEELLNTCKRIHDHGTEEELIEHMRSCLDKFPLRLLGHNSPDERLRRDAIQFYNEEFANSEIAFLQNPYKKVARVCNYLFDFQDDLQFNKMGKDLKRIIGNHGTHIFKERILDTMGPSRCFKLGHMLHIKSNFSPLTAKILYQTFVKPGGTIYDYSMGYGGRMLGAGLCKQNYKYLGVDPNSDNLSGYVRLGRFIQEINPHFVYEPRIIGSEIYVEEWEGIVDFSFSSPPYFDLELYTEEPTQAYIKFPEYNQFLEGYWRRTVQNAYRYLKPDGIFALNIKNKDEDYQHCTGKPYWDDFKRILEEEGFTMKEILRIKSAPSVHCAKDPDYEKNFENLGFFTKNGNIDNITMELPKSMELF